MGLSNSMASVKFYERLPIQPYASCPPPFSLFFGGGNTLRLFKILVDFLYTTGPIFRLKPSQKGTVSVGNCSGAAPIALGSNDQHMPLWARART